MSQQMISQKIITVGDLKLGNEKPFVLVEIGRAHV